MKKLLTLLTAFGIMSSTATMVVACGNNDTIKRWGKPDLLTDKVWEDILVKLMNDPNGDLSNITKGKRFKDIVSDTTIVLKMVQDRISKLTNQEFKNRINQSLDLSSLENYYKNQMNEISSDLAQNQFYLEYTNKLLTNKNLPSYDEQLSIGETDDGKTPLTTLNPKNLLRDDNKHGEERVDKNQYAIFMHQAKDDGTPDGSNTWLRWQYGGEPKTGIDSSDQLPTIGELQNNIFIILKNQNKDKIDDLDISNINKEQLFYKDSGGNPIGKDDNLKYIYSQDRDKPYEMNGQTALEYRFQEYFTKSIKNNYYANLLTMSYLDSNLFNISRNERATFSNQDAFLNISSNVAQTVQNWSQNNKTYNSNLKLIWSYTFDNNEKPRDAWDQKIFNLVNHENALKDTNLQSLENIYNELESAKDPNDNQLWKNISALGTDPFFNFNGYNGIVKNDGETIKSVNGKNLDIDEAAKSMIAKVNAPTILSKDYKGQPFESKNQKNKFEYIFVLPIYLIDLLNDRTEGYDNGQSTTAFALKENIGNDYKPNLLYTSYGEATSGNKKIEDKKLAYIVNNLNQPTTNYNYYIYANNGVPYTIDEIRSQIPGITKDNIWEKVKNAPETGDFKIEGIQFMTKNSNGTTFGNIGIRPLKDGETEDNAKDDASQWIKLGSNLTKPDNIPGQILFDEKDGNLYVRPISETLIGTFKDFSGFNLSFDDATKDGVYTVNGTFKDGENQGKTYSYKINMGPSASDSIGYIKKGTFDYYNSNISSLDISNLSSVKKTALLREIEYTTSNEPGVADTAAANIYPLFLEGNQILFEPLYNDLKKYIIDEGGGSSD